MNVLKQVFPKSAVVGVKAGIVKDFKDKYKIEKVRIVNDNHHAKDAYVSIISGNVFDTKFKHNAWAYFKNNDFEKYTLNASIYDSNVGSKEKPAWKGGANGSIKTIKKIIADEQSILYTRYAFIRDGSFFDENLNPKAESKTLIPSKTGDEHLINQSDREIVKKYGGYSSKYAYFYLVEDSDKIRSIVSVPAYLADSAEKDLAVLKNYLKNHAEIKEPKILMKKIKIGTLFCIDGFRVYLSGRKDENSIIFKPGVQLVLPNEMYTYSKKIEVFMKHNPKYSKSGIDEGVIEYYKFDSNKNLELYDLFLKKLTESPFNRSKSDYNKLNAKRTDFINLSMYKQVVVLFRLFKIFRCTAEYAEFGKDFDANFIISGKLGSIIGNKKIDIITGKGNGKKSIYILNQSPTGLLEHKPVDLHSEELKEK